jgi:hypothetical protein
MADAYRIPLIIVSVLAFFAIIGVVDGIVQSMKNKRPQTKS